MAQMIGTSRETVSRIMADFKKRHLVEQIGATLVVHNRVALQSMVAD
jgi:CRP-like cAMP-binding protein